MLVSILNFSSLYKTFCFAVCILRRYVSHVYLIHACIGPVFPFILADTFSHDMAYTVTTLGCNVLLKNILTSGHCRGVIGTQVADL